MHGALRVPRDLPAERRQAGRDDPRFDDGITGAQAVGTGCFAISGSGLLLEGLFADLEAMWLLLSDVAGSGIDLDHSPSRHRPSSSVGSPVH
jgi:hypothetical protein